MLVSRSLSYLAAARNGLSEDELLDVLSRDGQVMANFRQRSPNSPPMAHLPVVVWSRLYFDLKPCLTQRSADGTTLIDFSHRQLSMVVEKDYLADKTRQNRHQSLAQYFQNQPLHMQQDGALIANLRKLSELPYQQAYGEQWSALKETPFAHHTTEDAGY